VDRSTGAKWTLSANDTPKGACLRVIRFAQLLRWSVVSELEMVKDIDTMSNPIGNFFHFKLGSMTYWTVLQAERPSHRTPYVFSNSYLPVVVAFSQRLIRLFLTL